MSSLTFNEIERGALVDLRDVSIDTVLLITQRLESYLEQIRNPYFFTCENILAKIEYVAGAKPLEDKILDYFINLKNR